MSILNLLAGNASESVDWKAFILKWVLGKESL